MLLWDWRKDRETKIPRPNQTKGRGVTQERLKAGVGDYIKPLVSLSVKMWGATEPRYRTPCAPLSHERRPWQAGEEHPCWILLRMILSGGYNNSEESRLGLTQFQTPSILQSSSFFSSFFSPEPHQLESSSSPHPQAPTPANLEPSGSSDRLSSASTRRVTIYHTPIHHDTNGQTDWNKKKPWFYFLFNKRNI